MPPRRAFLSVRTVSECVPLRMTRCSLLFSKQSGEGHINHTTSTYQSETYGHMGPLAILNAISHARYGMEVVRTLANRLMRGESTDYPLEMLMGVEGKSTSRCPEPRIYHSILSFPF